MQNYKTVSLVLGAILLVAAIAGASIYFTKQPVAPTERIKVVAVQPSIEAPPPGCDDGNIAGKVVGGVGGGVIGSLAGKGGGKTAATIGGTLGGAYLGGEVLPLNNVICK
ncbi:MAG: hypothetical protein V1721_09190 [Pseudomonadota bacterium]